jgi:hypothetical protein
MINNIITYTYLRHFLKNWLMISILIVLFQSLFYYLKEIKLLSETYKQHNIIFYLSIKAIKQFFELAPITVFGSIILTNWQWTQQRLWLACTIIGLHSRHFLTLACLQLFLICVFILPAQLIFAPLLNFQAGFIRLAALDKLPKIHINELYVQQQQVFYPLSSEEIMIYNFETEQASLEPWTMTDQLTLKTPSSSLDLTWQLYKNLGLDSLTTQQKINLLQDKKIDSVASKDLRVELINNLSYIFVLILSVFLGWKASPIQTLKRSASLSLLKNVTYSIILYTGLKLLGLATLVLPISYIFLSYGMIILLSFLPLRVKRT